MKKELIKKKEFTKALLIGIFALFFIILLSSFVFAETTKPYDPKDPESWYSSKENIDKLKADLSDSKKVDQINSLIKDMPEDRKEYVFRMIAKQSPNSNQVIFRGLGNSNLKFISSTSGIIIGDGKTSVDISGFNKELKEVEYVSGTSKTAAKFVYRFSSGREISLEKGAVNSDGTYMELKDGKLVPTKISFLLPEKNSKISVYEKSLLPEGASTKEIPLVNAISLENGAKVKIDNLDFSQNVKGSKSVLALVDDLHFDALNIKMNRGDIAVTTPVDKATDIILKERPTSKDGGIVLDSINPAQGIRITDSGKIDITGEKIGLDILKDGKTPYKISAIGLGLTINNEKVSYKIEGDNTLVTRNAGDYKNLHPFELNNMREGDEKTYGKIFYTDKNPTAGEKAVEIVKPTEIAKPEFVPAEAKPAETTKPAEVKPAESAPSAVTVAKDASSDKKVCIGGVCAYGGVKALLGMEDPMEATADYQLGFGDKMALREIVSRSQIYVAESQVNEFLKSVPSGLSAEEFAGKLAETKMGENTQINIDLVRDLKKSDIDANLGKMLKPAGFSEDQMKSVLEFKNKVLSGDTVPKGTKISISTKTTGGSTSGIFVLQNPGSNPQTFVIGEGAKVKSMLLENFKRKPLTSEYLYQKYKGDTTNWDKKNP